MKTKIFLFTCVCFVFTFCKPPTQTIENWYQFRGPNGQGISQSTGLPTHWDREENVAWKTDIPGEAWSSPIVWNNHIFLTTTTDEGANCHVIALDRRTGNVLWDRIVFTQAPNQHRHPMNSYATPTPVTDGTTVFAVFSGGGFVALDFNGNIRWTNTETLDFHSQHGLSASPILHNDLLILPIDHSNYDYPRRLGWLDPWDKSFVLALDKNTGKERWRSMRGMSRIAHATPAMMLVGDKYQIISSAGDVIQGFDPTDGRLLWTIPSAGEPSVPSAVIGNGLVFTAPTGGRAPIRAVRPTADGNAELVWETSGSTPMMSSFLFVEPLLITCPENRVVALDAETGELLWEVPLRIGALNPSPIYADGKIYVLSEHGTTVVLQLSADRRTPPELIATNELEELTRASIAVAGNQLLIRTESALWAIGK